jgi:hypothetical protein
LVGCRAKDSVAHTPSIITQKNSLRSLQILSQSSSCFSKGYGQALRKKDGRIAELVQQLTLTRKG